MNIGIIILNYLAYEATMNCINCFEKQNRDNVNIEIVVVDNASTNKSYQILKERYMNDSLVHVYELKENVGFAKGNNYGYRKLLDLMEPDFVIISNDDIIIEQDGIFSWIDKCYKSFEFAVLGPKIYSVNGKFYQSPVEVLNRSILKCTYMLWSIKIRRKALEIKRTVLRNSKKEQLFTIWKNEYCNDFHDDMTLHGSFQIFSNRYFENYHEPYDPRTFLYMEEDLLRLRCDKKKLRMCYVPDFCVNHLQAMSSVLDQTSAYEKQITRMKHVENSMKIYLGELNKWL